MKRFGIPRCSVRPTKGPINIPLLGVEETLTVAALKRGGKKMSFVALSPVGRRRLPFASFSSNPLLPTLRYPLPTRRKRFNTSVDPSNTLP